MRLSADPSSFLCSVRALTRVTFFEGHVKLLDQSSNDWLTEYVFRRIARFRRGDTPRGFSGGR